MTNYLYCLRKKNSPRVHHEICEKNCKKVKKCLYYKIWYELTHDEPLITKVSKPKKKKKKRIYRKRKQVSKKVSKIS